MLKKYTFQVTRLQPEIKNILQPPHNRDIHFVCPSIHEHRDMSTCPAYFRVYLDVYIKKSLHIALTLKLVPKLGTHYNTKKLPSREVIHRTFFQKKLHRTNQRDNKRIRADNKHHNKNTTCNNEFFDVLFIYISFLDSCKQPHPSPR